ncbi:MAG: ABC transporter permease [Phototrophicaceae bacterium]
MLQFLRKPIGVFVVLHGVAHLLATSVYWKLNESEDLVYDTTILGGRLDLGETGIWIFGLIWLIAGLLTAVAGVGVLRQSAWARPLLLGVTLFSLAICLLVVESARIGVLVNLAILALIATRGQVLISQPASAR